LPQNDKLHFSFGATTSVASLKEAGCELALGASALLPN
jgi:hypothetical protein